MNDLNALQIFSIGFSVFLFTIGITILVYFDILIDYLKTRSKDKVEIQRLKNKNKNNENS